MDGLIGAAAPCDYMPVHVREHKIAKSGEPLELKLIETPDVVASAAATKRPNQWVIGFALETEDQRFRATVKMQRKFCDMMVSNDASAINSNENSVEILAPSGALLRSVQGSKTRVARAILETAQAELIAHRTASS
jgi:phosphopantothenoylcysteine decarboxylase/phosphopantothenate--cysteine ligase